MLATVYPRIKQASAAAKVIVGGLLLNCDPDVCTENTGAYLEGILHRNGANDGANYFDLVGFHAYDDYIALGQYQSLNWKTAWNTSGPVLIAKAAFLRQVLAKYDAANKPLMLTELALRCGTNAITPACMNGDFETTKAYYVAQAYSASIANDLQASIWYSMTGPWRNTSLLNDDLSPKPAYTAFTVARETLASAAVRRRDQRLPRRERLRLHQGWQCGVGAVVGRWRTTQRDTTFHTCVSNRCFRKCSARHITHFDRENEPNVCAVVNLRVSTSSTMSPGFD